MKKLLFATALLTSLLLSACGNQKADSDDLANQPATRPEEGTELDPEFSVDGEDTGETAEPQPDAELSGMVDAIYQLQPVEAMGIETVAVDLTDESWYGYLAGLTADNVGKVDAAVVSEPMTGSQAYSLVLLRLKDKADAREIADSMEENISMRKWVCVEIRPAWSALMISCCMSWQTVSWSMSICWRMPPQKPLMRHLMSMIPSSMRTRVSCPRSCCPPRLWQTKRYKKTKSRALCGARLLLFTGGIRPWQP